MAGRIRIGLALALVAALAACGGGPRGGSGGNGTGGGEARAAPEIRPVPGLPASFGDADPHDWQGRTPRSYPVHGTDVARFQGAVDWKAAQRAGISFAWIKATEGGDRLDPMFHQNYRDAAAAGVARGAYHFYYFCRPAIEQARWFIRNVPRTPGALPPALDLEWNPFSPTCTYRPPAETVRAEAKVFLDALERHYGTRPVIYTTPDFYDRNDMGQLRGYDFWLRSTAAHPSVRYPNQRWTFWQYTGTGLAPGFYTKVDLNAFNGSGEAFARWLVARRQ